jgi:hypothetical protein
VCACCILCADLKFLSSHGFNALRIPLAADTIAANPLLQANMISAEPALQLPKLRYLDALDRLISLAATYDMLIMLDMHRRKAAVWPDPTGLWFEGAATDRAATVRGEGALLATWQVLLQRYCGRCDAKGDRVCVCIQVCVHRSGFMDIPR